MNPVILSIAIALIIVVLVIVLLPYAGLDANLSYLIKAVTVILCLAFIISKLLGFL